MNPGRLNRIISIEQRTINRDSFGAFEDSWSVVMPRVPARLIYRVGTERDGSGQRVDSTHCVFQVRWRGLGDRINPADHRVIYRGEIYDIKGLDERGAPSELLDITTQRRSTVTT